jgi:hypothetical protein
MGKALTAIPAFVPQSYIVSRRRSMQEDKLPTWEQLAIEYLDAADLSLFDRFKLEDYERMAVWVRTEYGIPAPEFWSSHYKRKQARQMEGGISRLRKHQRNGLKRAALEVDQ